MRTKYIALLTVSLVVLGLYVATRSVPRHSRAPNPETSARATEAPNPRTVGPNNPRDPKAEKGERSTPPTLLAEMAPFEQWLRAFQLGQNPTPTEGQRLAAVRRSALKTLIAVDPKTALAHAVDADLRETLPLSIVALLETPVNAFGKYTVIAACGPTSASVSRWVETDSNCYQAYVYGQRLAALSKDRMAIHGIALDDEMAVSEKSYRTLSAKEAAIHAQAGAVVVQVGNAYRAFSTAADLNQWQANVTEAENVPGPGAVQALLVPMTAGSGGNTVTAADVTSSWVFGNKSVLWIRAEFPDDPGSPASDQDVGTAMTAVNSFYARNSRNRTSFTTTVGKSRVNFLKLLRTPHEERLLPVAWPSTPGCPIDEITSRTAVYGPVRTVV